MSQEKEKYDRGIQTAATQFLEKERQVSVLQDPLDGLLPEDEEEISETLMIHVGEEQSGMRIDRFLSGAFPQYTRSFFQKLLREEMVFANQKVVRASYPVRSGDRIEVLLPQPKTLEVKPENLPLDILYEDADLLVINKPKDMVVHPAPGHEEHTVVNAVLFHCGDQLSGINGVLRPGIVHRIDKDTTGAIVICKTDQAHLSLADQLRTHSITRRYEAIAWNNFKEDMGTVDAPIGRSVSDRKKMAVNVRNGRHAVTHYRVLTRFGTFTHVECELETGRTHQIRVHMASIGHPLLGDEVYGPSGPVSSLHGLKLQGQTLHAGVLGFVHPRTGEYMEFTAPLPAYFQKLLQIL